MDIAGTYKGLYFMRNEQEGHAFELNLQGDENFFTGHCKDDITVICNLPKAKITGAVSGKDFYFIKEYACLILSDNDGGPLPVYDQPSFVIEYKGTWNLSAGGVHIKGIWQIDDENNGHFYMQH